MIIEMLFALQQVTGCATDCAISATKLVVLSDPQGLGVVSQPTGLTRMRNGQWVLTHGVEPDRVNLFSASGSFVRAVGRSGEGPGEYRAATLATAGPGDSIWVLDQGLNRVSVLDPDLRYVRSFTVPTSIVSDMAVLEDGRLIVRSHIRMEERAGYPLHVIDATGAMLRSFGTETRSYRRDQPSLSRRSFWPVGGSRLWIADLVQYRIQLWDLDGGKLREIVREADWFAPHESFEYPDDLRAEPHPPGLIAVHQDSSGILWTMIRLGDPDWRSAIADRRNILGRVAPGVVDRNKYWDTIVEALDPNTGRVIASSRFDGLVLRFVNDRLAVEYVEDSQGEPSIVVWQFALTPKSREVPP